MSTTANPALPGLNIAGRPISVELALTVASFMLGLATILGAWGSQIFGGLVPCELCLAQRQAYYWGLPVLALILIFWNRVPRPVWYVAMAIGALIFVWSAEMGAYHAGVEWGWWKGPTACTGLGDALDFSQLKNMNSARVIPCDAVQFRFLGISLAGYNALISMAIVIMLGCAIALRARKARAAA